MHLLKRVDFLTFRRENEGMILLLTVFLLTRSIICCSIRQNFRFDLIFFSAVFDRGSFCGFCF